MLLYCIVIAALVGCRYKNYAKVVYRFLFRMYNSHIVYSVVESSDKSLVGKH